MFINPIFSIGLIAIVLIGVLTMWYILYTKIVAAGRRKRDIYDYFPPFLEHIDSALVQGIYFI